MTAWKKILVLFSDPSRKAIIEDISMQHAAFHLLHFQGFPFKFISLQFDVIRKIFKRTQAKEEYSYHEVIDNIYSEDQREIMDRLENVKSCLKFVFDGITLNAISIEALSKYVFIPVY